MKRLILLFCLFLPSFSLADIHHPPLEINNNGTISYGWFYLLTITGGSGTFTNNGDGTLTMVCSGGSTNFFLLEDSSIFLLEDGTNLVLQ